MTSDAPVAPLPGTCRPEPIAKWMIGRPKQIRAFRLRLRCITPGASKSEKEEPLCEGVKVIDYKYGPSTSFLLRFVPTIIIIIFFVLIS